MKYTSIIVLVALFLSSAEAVKVYSVDLAKKDVPPPTASDTPTSGYYGADEDDVMNNIFNHYGVPITNAAGVPTG